MVNQNNPMLLNWVNIQPDEMLPGLHARIVHADKMTIIWWNIDEEAILPEHSHPHEQVATCISGEFELTIDGQEFYMTANTTLCIPSNAVHSGRAISNCVIYDVFTPLRADYPTRRAHRRHGAR